MRCKTRRETFTAVERVEGNWATLSVVVCELLATMLASFSNIVGEFCCCITQISSRWTVSFFVFIFKIVDLFSVKNLAKTDTFISNNSLTFQPHSTSMRFGSLYIMLYFALTNHIIINKNSNYLLLTCCLDYALSLLENVINNSFHIVK